MDKSSSSAEAVVAKYPAGAETTAYHDPSNPADAYLERTYHFGPYGFVLFPMIHSTIGLALLLGVVYKPGAPTSSGSLRSDHSLNRAAFNARVLALFWIGVGVPAIAHYFAVASPPFGWIALVASSVYVGVGVVLAWRYLEARKVSRFVNDAEVTVSNPTPRPGERIDVSIVQTADTELLVKVVKIALECVEHTRRGKGTKSDVLGGDTETRPDTILISPQNPLSLRCNLRLPPNLPPSSTTSKWSYPRIDWQIVVEIEYDGVPRYRAAFPLVVADAYHATVSANPSSNDTSGV